jgi:hypothetical protein
MSGYVTVEIPVSPEAARLLRDAKRAQKVGELVSDLLRPSAPENDPLAALIADVKAAAHADGLTDEEIEAELRAHNAERRL